MRNLVEPCSWSCQALLRDEQYAPQNSWWFIEHFAK